MSRWVQCAAAGVMFFLPLPVRAWGWWVHRASRITYYCPAPVVWQPAAPVLVLPPVPPCVPAPVVCPPASRPVPAPRLFAPPTAAPPSGAPQGVRSTREPPLNQPTTSPPGSAQPPLSEQSRKLAPAVSEWPSYFDSYTGSLRTKDKPAGARCQVGFWNLSGRVLRLKVDGQTRTLPAGKKLTLDLGRQFVWRVDERDPQSENIPAQDSSLEIVIRR